MGRPLQFGLAACLDLVYAMLATKVSCLLSKGRQCMVDGAIILV